MADDSRQRARRLLQSEQRYVTKDWGGRISVAIVYPNSYYLGMSNLGIHILYSLFNANPDVVCERVFWEHDGQAPVSIESQRDLGEFDVVAFSVTYELDYFNIPRILRAAGIPVLSAQRSDSCPLLIAGGVCVTSNPAPVAPFFDAICVGEAEAIVPALLEGIRSTIGQRREQRMSALARIGGIFVPAVAKAKVARQWCRNLEAFPVHTVVLTEETELGGMYLIEAERGCRWRCRFCLVCGAFRPMRVRTVDSLLEQAREGLKYRTRIGLVGPDVPDHPGFEALFSELKKIGAEISVSSLRIKPVSDVAIRELSRHTGSLAFAPEAGSERLRSVIRKDVTEDDILTAMDTASRHPVKQVRLYFMIGLPTENEDDVQAIIGLSSKCKAVFDKNRSGARITLSVAPFVPKAGTPFQWLAMEGIGTLSDRLNRLKNALMPKGIRVVGESPQWSEVQAALARGGTDLAGVIENVKENQLSLWRNSVRSAGIDVDGLVHTAVPFGRDLPWDFIDSGISRGYLEAEARAGLSVPPSEPSE